MDADMSRTISPEEFARFQAYDREESDWQKEKEEFTKLKRRQEEWELSRKANDDYANNQQNQITALEERLKSKDQEIVRIKQDLKSDRDGRVSAEGAVEAGKSSIARVEQKLKKEKEDHAETKSLYDRIKMDFHKADLAERQNSDKYWNLRTEKDELSVDVEALKEALSDANTSMAAANAEIEDLRSTRERLAGLEEILQEQFGRRGSLDIHDMSVYDITKFVSEEMQASLFDRSSSPELHQSDAKSKRQYPRSTSFAQELERSGITMNDDDSITGQSSPELDRKRRSADSSKILRPDEDIASLADQRRREPHHDVVPNRVATSSEIFRPQTVVSYSPTEISPKSTVDLPRSLTAWEQRRLARESSKYGSDVLIPIWMLVAAGIALFVGLVVLHRLYSLERIDWLQANDLTRQRAVELRQEARPWPLITARVVHTLESTLGVRHHLQG